MSVTEVKLLGSATPAGEKPAGLRRAYITAIQVSVVVALLLLWEFLSRAQVIDPMLVGRPSQVGPAIVDYVTSPKGLQSLLSTAVAVLVSFVIGSVTGTLAGLALGLGERLDSVFGPFLGPLNSIPRIALAPLFIAWFGLTITAKVVLAVSIVFFILAENARSAVRSVDTEIMRMARVAGLKPASQLWKVVMPSAVPTLFAGLRLAFTYSLLGVVASEMIAAPDGVGQDIVLFSTSYKINSVFAVLVILVVVSIGVNAIFTALERWFLRWQPATG